MGTPILLELTQPLRPRRNGPHFADDVFKCIFVNENVQIAIKISPEFVPKGPINNIPSSVQIMAWRRPGDKPLSEQVMFFVQQPPTHSNMYNKNCMYPFVNYMYCKFSGINDSWFPIPD